MKILSVKVLGNNFRSLEANRLYEFNHSMRVDRLSTKIFAGLNGSGKSNFLELFSEIFYHLEICHLSTVGNSEKEGNNFGFEIEYLLPADQEKVYNLYQEEFSSAVEEYVSSNLSLTSYTEDEFRLFYNEEIEKIIFNEHMQRSSELLINDYLHVKVTKQIAHLPSFSLRKIDLSSISVTKKTGSLLPKRVIAYTSGQNELLSNPYHKIKYHYFKEFNREGALANSEIAEENRLFYLDYSSNFSIFIANMLLADSKKLSYLTEILNISGLSSFRITINLVDAYKKAIPISDRLMANLKKLQSCATTWTRKTQGSADLLVLDYYVDDATRSAFSFHFQSAFSLFKVFYELDILNLHLVKKDTRNLMLRVHKHFNFSDELPKGDPSRLVFRLEQILITKETSKNEIRKIYYKGLSDGEHQFNEVIGTTLMMEQEGCLFLMDEPDTHFNPKWRAKMIEMFNYVTADSFVTKERFKLDIQGNQVRNLQGDAIKEYYSVPDNIRRQEIIITTHSPFVISDSLREDVYKFDKHNGKATYMNPKIETYGASVGLLMQEIFDRKISISDLSHFDMSEWRQAFMQLLEGGDIENRVKDIRNKINEVKSYLIEFGESIEKFDLFSFINEVEKDLNRLR